MNQEEQKRYKIKQIKKYKKEMEKEEIKSVLNVFLIGLQSSALVVYNSDISQVNLPIFFDFMATVGLFAATVNLVENIIRRSNYQKSIEDIKYDLALSGYEYKEETEEKRGRKK